jgi:hypothetical protein
MPSGAFLDHPSFPSGSLLKANLPRPDPLEPLPCESHAVCVAYTTTKLHASHLLARLHHNEQLAVASQKQAANGQKWTGAQ